MNAFETNASIPVTPEEEMFFAEKVARLGFQVVTFAGQRVLETAENLLSLFEKNNVAGTVIGDDL